MKLALCSFCERITRRCLLQWMVEIVVLQWHAFASCTVFKLWSRLATHPKSSSCQESPKITIFNIISKTHRANLNPCYKIFVYIRSSSHLNIIIIHYSETRCIFFAEVQQCCDSTAMHMGNVKFEGSRSSRHWDNPSWAHKSVFCRWW